MNRSAVLSYVLGASLFLPGAAFAQQTSTAPQTGSGYPTNPASQPTTGAAGAPRTTTGNSGVAAAKVSGAVATATSDSQTKTHLELHLELSDSVAENLRAKKITALHLEGVSQFGGRFIVTGKDASDLATDVAAGKWLVRAFLTVGGATYAGNPAGVKIDVPRTRTFQATIPIRSRIVAGSVKFGGEPFPGRMNFFATDGRHRSGFSVPFDAQGHFVFPLSHAGPFDVVVLKASGEYVTKIVDFAFSRSEGSTAETVVPLPAGTIAGRTVDASGRAVVGVHVRAVLARGAKLRPLSLMATSDDSGKFAFAGLVGGDWMVDAMPRSRGGEPQQISLRPDAHKEGIVLEVTPRKQQPPADAMQ